MTSSVALSTGGLNVQQKLILQTDVCWRQLDKALLHKIQKSLTIIIELLWKFTDFLTYLIQTFAVCSILQNIHLMNECSSHGFCVNNIQWKDLTDHI